MLVAIYIHVYPVNDYLDILRGFYAENPLLFKNSEINIRVTDTLRSRDGISKIKSVFNQDISLKLVRDDYEFPTIEEIHTRSKQSEDNIKILYIHTKGVTTPNNICIKEWRDYMSYFLIGRYKICLDALDKYNTCAVDFRFDPCAHYSGNFWWANSYYLQSLKSVKDVSSPLTERHKCEFWVCSGKDSKNHSIYDSKINAFERHLTRYPRRLYES